MRTVGHPLFLGVLICYIVYYILKRLTLEMPDIVTSYFADIVSLFLINTFVLFIIRKLKSSSTLELPVLIIALGFVLTTLLFEWFFPLIYQNTISDPIDIVCYAISSLAYLVWRKNWSIV